MQEFVFSFEKMWMYVRHSTIYSERPTVLCIHGLGESGLSFQELAVELYQREMNVVVPDLIGYGRSSAAEDAGGYRFDSQIDCLWKLINDKFGLSEVVLVGHSMGGDIGTLMCAGEPNRVRKFINLEGNLTEADTFICSSAVRASEVGKYDDWFQSNFVGQPASASLRRYYASVRFSRGEAFLENAREMHDRNRAAADGSPGEIGSTYASLSVPRLFCWHALNDSTQAFLIDQKLANEEIDSESHWMIVEQPKMIAATVRQFVKQCQPG